MANSISYRSLPFSEQIAFFRRKLNVPTESWLDIYGEQHDWAFVVAGANRDDIVADFREAVDKFIVDGGTLEQFRADFDSIVAKFGWDYNGGRNWRSKVIYDTNLFSSYQAGRFAQQWSLRETMPFLEYCHSDAVEEPRELHLSWHGLILAIDDPWWLTHYPINAWGCQCYTISRSWDDLKRLGKSGPDIAPPINYVEKTIGKNSPGGPRVVTVPDGIDPGFEHTPGRSRLDSQITPPANNSPVSAGANRLPADDIAQEIDRFLAEFDAQQQSRGFHDVTNEPIVIGHGLFQSNDGIVINNEYGGYLPFLADAIKTPDEIWTFTDYDKQTQKAVVKRRYLKQVSVDGEPLLVIFETGKTGWSLQVLPGEHEDDAALRPGALAYRRLS